jgi:hypothetical protein
MTKEKPFKLILPKDMQNAFRTAELKLNGENIGVYSANLDIKVGRETLTIELPAEYFDVEVQK